MLVNTALIFVSAVTDRGKGRRERVKRPPMRSSHEWDSHSASDDTPDLKESDLIISILRKDGTRITITHLSIPIISQFVRALHHYKAKWSMKRKCVRERG